MKSILPKSIKIVVGVILALVLVAWVLSISKSNKTTPDTPVGKKEVSSSTSNSIDLAMVGDMLPHETVTNAAKTSDGYDYLKLISPELQKAFKKADLRFCNQEAVSSGSLPVSGYPAFNAPVAFPRDLSSFGCDLVSTANNHAADQGLAGIKGTLEAWDSHTSTTNSGSFRDKDEEQNLNIVEKNGIKVGFTAFNEVNNISPPQSSAGINMLSNQALLGEQIKGLKAKSDVVVVSVHWGSEDSHTLTSSQKNYAKQISDLGADIIIGTGPHVWQSFEELSRPDGDTTYLWNSIGNGLNSQTKQDQLFSGVALLKISKEKDGRVVVASPRVLPTYMHYVWGSGVGTSQSQLLARKNLKWTTLNGSQSLIDQRNDFKTTEAQQKDRLKQYLANDKVEILNSY